MFKKLFNVLFAAVYFLWTGNKYRKDDHDDGQGLFG